MKTSVADDLSMKLEKPRAKRFGGMRRAHPFRPHRRACEQQRFFVSRAQCSRDKMIASEVPERHRHPPARSALQ
jgi:hypothetical protein